jgi:hypothetical protein
MARTGKTSPWVYVAIGCGVTILLGVAVVVGGGFMVYRWGKRMERDLKDPATREARVREVLGAERIPEGYHAVVGMEVPFIMEMAILSDVPPREGEDEPPRGFEQRGFFYFRMASMLSGGRDRRRLEDYFEGRSEDADFLRHGSIHFDRGEVLGRGEIEVPGAARARYVAQRGSIAMGGAGGGAGLTSMVLVDCEGDGRLRMAIWFGPDPQREAPEGEASLAGSAADPEALAAFLGNFRFCSPAP